MLIFFKYILLYSHSFIRFLKGVRCVTSSNGPPSVLTCPQLLLKTFFRTFSVLLLCSLPCVKRVTVSEQLTVALLLKET